jgi:hypothetical protein
MAEMDDNQNNGPLSGARGGRVRYALEMSHELLLSIHGILVSSQADEGQGRQVNALVAAEHLIKMAHRYLDVGFREAFDEPGFGTFEAELTFFRAQFPEKP